MLCVWLLALTLTISTDPANQISDVHAKSAALRRELLKDWTFAADGTPEAGTYFATYAGAPIQHIIANLYLNENTTAVALAHAALANPNMSSHFAAVYEWTCIARAFALFNSKTGGCAGCATMHKSTEEAMKNMTFHFAIKNNGAGMFCNSIPPSKGGGSMCTSGSENLDYDAKTSGYIALRELSKFPEYKSRLLGSPPPPPPPPPPHNATLPKCNSCCKAGCGLKCCSPTGGPQKCCCLARVKTPNKCPPAPPLPPPPPPVPLMTVAEAAEEWDLFFYNKLKDQALSGLFSENGSPNYWYRTWPAIFNLADLGSARVRQRAKMFIDLAFVEGESLLVGGYRAGAKMRAKKDGGDYPVLPSHDKTSPIVAYQAGVGRCAGDSLKPVLLGEGQAPVWKYADGQGVDTLPVWWPHFASTPIEMQTSSYNMSSTAIMLRARSAEQEQHDSSYRVQNRLLGEANGTAGLSLNSSIVHHFYRTGSYGLGSIFFNPAKANTSFGAPPQESMIELVFANAEHTTVGKPHAAGSAWCAQSASAVVLAKCGGALGCHYDGDFSHEIYNASVVHHSTSSGWVFVEPANGLRAWAAARFAWGGLNGSASYVSEGVAGSDNSSFKLVPTDPAAPMVLFVGNASAFGSFAQFVASVESAELSVKSHADGTKDVTFTPPAAGGAERIVFPWSQSKATLRMPSIGGKPLEDQPVEAYSGPFMQSTLGTTKVRTKAGSWSGAFAEEFDFETDSIRPM